MSVVSAVAFVVVERRSAHPMVPLACSGSRQFSGANVVTLFVYAALGATTFLLVVHLQEDLGYSALEAGASLLPDDRADARSSRRARPRWRNASGPACR